MCSYSSVLIISISLFSESLERNFLVIFIFWSNCNCQKQVFIFIHRISNHIICLNICLGMAHEHFYELFWSTRNSYTTKREKRNSRPCKREMYTNEYILNFMFGSILIRRKKIRNSSIASNIHLQAWSFFLFVKIDNVFWKLWLLKIYYRVRCLFKILNTFFSRIIVFSNVYIEKAQIFSMIENFTFKIFRIKLQKIFLLSNHYGTNRFNDSMVI